MTPASSTTNFVDTSLGLAFHSDSAFLRGIKTRAQQTTLDRVSGAVIAARSENDTSNNPHNPMYGIAKAGAKGELLTLIGSQSSDSGGNSMAPAMMIDLTVRPTKIDRTTDARGLVDTGELASLLPQQDTVAVMESIERVSKMKLDAVNTKLGNPGDADAKKLAQCGYVKTAYLAESFGSPAAVDPSQDPDIKGGAGIFTDAEYTGDREFEKTASVMLAAQPDDRSLDETRDKVHLLKGVLSWQLDESYKARVWTTKRSLKELDLALREMEKRWLRVQQARDAFPNDTAGFATRVAALKPRIEALNTRLAAASRAQGDYLAGIAINELEAQKERLASYQVQARFALATIYDRSAKSGGTP